MRHGYGKYYDKAGTLVYDGQYEHGVEAGHGTLYFQSNGCLDKSKFIGQMVNGCREGYGEYFDENGTLRYSGQYKNNARHGQGNNYNKTGVLFYTGGHKDGFTSGHGTLYLQMNGRYAGSKYVGQMAANKRHGYGIEYYCESPNVS